MRVFSLRTALCLTLAALTTSTGLAGVRGKSTKPKDPAPVASPAVRRAAQSDADQSVNSVPVPVDANATNERVIHETTINPAANGKPTNNFHPATVMAHDPSCNCAAPAAARLDTVVMPMMSPAYAPISMISTPSCWTCGGGLGGGLSPAASAAYHQAFGPGLYRTGAEAGQYHFPYYSYRRPWYFPGQPSFHRSTDYVW